MCSAVECTSAQYFLGQTDFFLYFLLLSNRMCRNDSEAAAAAADHLSCVFFSVSQEKKISADLLGLSSDQICF